MSTLSKQETSRTESRAEDTADSGKNETRTATSHRMVLLIIIMLGLAVRGAVWYAWRGQPVQIVDAQDYNRLAIGLVNTGSYITPSGELSSLRPPLYPWILAQIYRASGLENYAVVRAFQALLSLVTVLIAYRMGVVLYSRNVGLLAAALVCFYPSLLVFNNFLLSETLFTFLVCAGTWCIVEALHKDSFSFLIFAGVVFGLGALTRSILLMTMPFLAMFLLVAWPGAVRRKVIAAVLPCLFFTLVIAPWAYRNTQVQQVFTPIDVMGGRNAMMGNYEYTPLERSWATITDVTGERAWHVMLRKKYPEVKGMTQGQLDKVAMKYGIEFVIAHPVLTAKRTVVRFFNFWQLERTLLAGAHQGLWGSFSKAHLLLLGVFICGSYVLAMFAGIFGALLAPPEDRRYYWLLLISIAVPCLIHSAIFAHSRYHLPLMPLILLFSAACVVRSTEIWKSRRTWRFCLASVFCLMIALGWVREIVFVDLANAQSLLP